MILMRANQRRELLDRSRNNFIRQLDWRKQKSQQLNPPTLNAEISLWNRPFNL
jgi:hypothetical protein